MNVLSKAGGLADTLRKFNRKERYWVYREIFGHEQEVPLSEAFLEKFIDNPNEVPAPTAKAWWATDFHFDWLLAAIYLHYTGETGCDDERVVSLIRGNQEDVDLLICEGSNLWLCEAKFATRWNQDQLRSKKNRVDRLVDLRNIVAKDLQFYLVNMYPRGRSNPQKGSREARLVNFEISMHERDERIGDAFSVVTRTDKSDDGNYTRFKITTDVRISN